MARAAFRRQWRRSSYFGYIVRSPLLYTVSFGLVIVGLSPVLYPSAIQAAPTDRVVQALAASTGDPVASASKKVFLRAWTAVIAGVDESELSEYVTVAVQLRPDLAPPIVQRTLSILIEPRKIRPSEKQLRIARQVVECAVRVSPTRAAAIVMAALIAQPYFRAEIIAAATSAAPDQRQAIADAAAPYSVTLASLNFSQKTNNSMNTVIAGGLNPANIDATGDRDETVRSPEKAP